MWTTGVTQFSNAKKEVASVLSNTVIAKISNPLYKNYENGVNLRHKITCIKSASTLLTSTLLSC